MDRIAVVRLDRKVYCLNTRSSFLFFLLLVLIQIAATNTKGARLEAPPKASRNNTGLGPQGLVSDTIVNFFGSRKTGHELMLEKKEKGENPSRKAASVPAKVMRNPAKVSDVSGDSGAKGRNFAVPHPPSPQVPVPELRQEIQRVLDMNKRIQTLQGGSAAQLQRVQEQARIHQRILNQLESSAASKDRSGKNPEKDVLLAQEKMRIIYEETRSNRAMFEEVVEDAPVATPAGSVVLEFKRPGAQSASPKSSSNP